MRLPRCGGLNGQSLTACGGAPFAQRSRFLVAALRRIEIRLRAGDLIRLRLCRSHLPQRGRLDLCREAAQEAQ